MRTRTSPIMVGQSGYADMPYSEVCMCMQIAGKPMHFKVISPHAVQLYRDVELTLPFSGPITIGEAGIYHDGDHEMYYYPAEMPVGDPAR